MVGVMTAKALALASQIPFLGVNHLEAHALTVRLTGNSDGTSISFPYLLLLVSGGHCQLLNVKGVGCYQRFGTTIDDALGEAFDKTARMLGLGYPGGPAVERLAREGDPCRFALPRPMKGRDGCDFSFSGLKTKIRQTIESLPDGPISHLDAADICAGFQTAVGEVLADRSANAIRGFLDQHEPSSFVMAGGVAANQFIREKLEILSKEHGMCFAAPPIELCTDNGAMVAWAGLERLQIGDTDNLDFKPRPRWPLDPDAPRRAYAGVKA